MEVGDDVFFFKLRVSLLKLAERKINRREDAEDLVHETMAVVVEKYKAMTFEKGLVYWAFAILQKKIMRYYRDKRYAGKLAQAVQSLPVDQGARSNPEEAYMNKELEDRLYEAVQELDGDCRRILLSLLDGKSRDELAAEFNLSRDALYARVSRCKRRLMEILGRKYPI